MLAIFYFYVIIKLGDKMALEDMIYNQVEEILNKMRPYLQRDGGDVELINVENGIVYVRLLGACSGCALSSVTLSEVVEAALIEEVPGIIKVVDVDE